ncbi:polysaccharide pyruvyl transferase family protein [Microbacterium testaceum]|uniref:polysaccharide pyruvyl transferase family protein n=1 Tax=Microbacterium testaceum TaxID=2033 RepID=UPI0002D84821|nr:polysaccharide pyruvyl transferase family protein [Microbacterium testaceum]
MPHVFVAVTGQEDNLGDSVLRRGLLNALRPSGSRLHILTGKNSPAYCSALGLSSDDVVFTDTKAWMSAFDRSVASSERTHFVFNAGEARIERAHSYIGAKLLARLTATRARGGRVVHTGIGIRAAQDRRTTLARLGLRTASIVTWRDQVSADITGIGRVEPDWAFALGSRSAESVSGDRPRLVVSMRGDRDEPGEGWYATVRGLADAAQLELLVASQVVRDNDRARRIAARLGDVEVSTWDEGDHAQRESEMRAIFAGSRAVVSDRLHALVIGATEGATPLGFTATSPEKVRRTLAVAGLEKACAGVDDFSDTERATTALLAALSMDTDRRCASARERLTSLTSEMTRALS